MSELVLIRVADGQITRGLSADEIANIVNVPMGTFEWSIHTFGEYYNSDYIAMKDWRAQSYANREHIKETRH